MRSAHPVLSKIAARRERQPARKTGFRIGSTYFVIALRSFANLRGYSLPASGLGLCCCAACRIGCIAAEQRLDDARVLVDQRDCRAVVTASRDQVLQPEALRIGFCRCIPQHRPRAVDEQGPQVCVAAPADAVQAGLASRGVLAWYQAEPGRQMPSVPELPWSPTAATMAVAVIGPMPGTSAIFLHSVDCFMNDWIDASIMWTRSSIA
jgi:hypothetical protein